MSQNSTITTATTTTSFIISSNESLNKPISSSSSASNQSTEISNNNMTACDSSQINNNQYYVSLNSLSNNNNNNITVNHHPRIHPSINPPLPPTSSSSSPATTTTYMSSQGNNNTSNGSHYGISSGCIQSQTTATSQASANLNVNESLQAASIYGIYTTTTNYQSNNNLQSPIKNNNNDINNIQLHNTQQQHLINNDNRLSFANNNVTTREQQQQQQLMNNNGQSHQNILYTNANSHLSSNNNDTLKYSPNSQSFQSNRQQSTTNNNNSNNQRTSISSLESTASNSLMPINVKGMLLHGIASDEVMRAWLASIKCEEYVKNFIDNGYDIPLLSRMTPQDLAAIGCKTPALRKKLLLEIKKLNQEDDIPDTRPQSLEKWLELLKLGGYFARLCHEGYNTIDKVCDLTWEDLEEIGITKLGHQKRLLLGIERLKKFEKLQEDQQNDHHTIYDVHPNHRISLYQNNNNSENNRLSTINRATVRSGFFQTRSGANLDHRGLPVATVMPALNYVTNSLANLDISHQDINSATQEGITKNSNSNINNNQIYSTYQATTTMPEQILKMNDLSATMKRNPPPLPPVRTNSLKMPDMTIQNNNNNSIYGNGYGLISNGHQQQPGSTMTLTSTAGSTSFLRTPKLGTLTATTNKMLTSGGHIQSVNGTGQQQQQQQETRTIMPIREAPLPPIPSQPPPIRVPVVVHANDSSSPFTNNVSALHEQATGRSLINPSSLISHQLASADEFPPPPPPTS